MFKTKAWYYQGKNYWNYSNKLGAYGGDVGNNLPAFDPERPVT